MSDSPRMPVEDAISRIIDTVPRLPTEEVPLRAAVGRVLAEQIDAAYTHPAWRNSAMDGYAVHADDVRGATRESPVSLSVLGTIAAGDVAPATIQSGSSWRIMTGAPVPDNIDTVIRVEDTDAGLDRVLVHDDRDATRNIRPSGEDFRAGHRLMLYGTVLRPAHVALAAANGRRSMLVIRKPRVAILTSGNELVDVDQFDDVLTGRRIINTNGYALAAAVHEAGGVPIPLGIAKDDPAAIAERITSAPEFDVLITSGGISVGAFDYTRDVVQRLGATLDFWRVRMRPGGPFGFGMLGTKPWFGLPGNPVSAMVTFEIFVRPTLRFMGVHIPLWRESCDVTLGDAVHTPGGLTHFLRVVIDGDRVARLTGPQGSGLLTSMMHANGLLVVPHDVAQLDAGASARAMLLPPGLPQQAVPWTF